MPSLSEQLPQISISDKTLSGMESVTGGGEKTGIPKPEFEHFSLGYIKSCLNGRLYENKFYFSSFLGNVFMYLQRTLWPSGSLLSKPKACSKTQVPFFRVF